jgi:hypothetical protein
MVILVACECSGTVRDALRSVGHDATSCDLLPTRTPGPHVQGDVRPLLERQWDAVIAFPPCTDLAVSGAKHFAAKRADGRQQASVDFFLMFTRITCPRVVIENPVGIMSGIYRRPDQIVHPWMFGDEASKSTCLWLKGLPKLQHVAAPDLFNDRATHVGRGAFHVTKGGNRLPAWYHLPPGPERANVRSKTFPGIAAAMAAQWFR